MTTTTTNLPADKPAKRSMRQQWTDMLVRFHAMPKGQRWLVIGVLTVLGLVLVNEYSWTLAGKWSDQSDSIEQALQRSRNRDELVTAELRREVSIYGPVVPPKQNDEGGEALTRAIEDTLNKHKVTGLSFDRRSGQRMRDSEGNKFGGAGLDRLQADVKFDTDAERLPAILADLESNEHISSISSLRIQASNTGTKRLSVQATIEAWVQAGRGRKRSP